MSTDRLLRYRLTFLGIAEFALKVVSSLKGVDEEERLLLFAKEILLRNID